MPCEKDRKRFSSAAWKLPGELLSNSITYIDKERIFLFLRLNLQLPIQKRCICQGISEKRQSNRDSEWNNEPFVNFPSPNHAAWESFTFYNVSIVVVAVVADLNGGLWVTSETLEEKWIPNERNTARSKQVTFDRQSIFQDFTFYFRFNDSHKVCARQVIARMTFSLAFAIQSPMNAH